MHLTPVCQTVDRERKRIDMPGILGQGPVNAPARTRYNFARELLQELQLPVTENNIRAILAQMLAEEPAGEGAPNNPLNTTLDVGKYGGWSASPNIAKYPSWTIGVQETADTYRSPLYAAIRRDFKASADPRKTVSDIGSSPWGTSGSLMQQILGSGGDLARNATVPGSGTVPPNLLPEGGITQAVGDAKDSAFSWVKDSIGNVLGFLLRGGKVLLGILLIGGAIFIGMKA
jgi:hypothetical protein